MTTYYVNVKQYFHIEKIKDKALNILGYRKEGEMERDLYYLWSFLKPSSIEELYEEIQTEKFPSKFEVLDFGTLGGQSQNVLPSHKNDLREVLYISLQTYMETSKIVDEFRESFETFWEDISIDNFWYSRYHTSITKTQKDLIKSFLNHSVFGIDTENFYNARYIESHLRHQMKFKTLEEVLGKYFNAVSQLNMTETALEGSRYMVGNILLSVLDTE